MKKERQFYSLGCANCDDMAYGRNAHNLEFIPIFRTKELALLELASLQAGDFDEQHPMKLITINVQIL